MSKVKTIIKSKYFLLNLLMLISIIFPACHALDYNIKISEPQEYYDAGSYLHLGFEATGRRRSDFLRPFKCRLYFDPDTLKYKKIICKNSVKRTDIRVEKFDNYIDIVCKPNALRELYFPNNVSDIFDLVFIVNKKVNTHESDISAEFKSFNEENTLNSENIRINIRGNPLLENCKLNFLEISEGNISPNFSPDIYEYAVTVPYYTKQLDVQAIPMYEDLSVKINKRNLNAQGGTANITIVVSNKSLGAKSVYTIRVSREKNTDNNSSYSKPSNKTSEKDLSKIPGGSGKILNEQIDIFEPDKKSSKTKSSKSNHKKKHKNSKNSTENAKKDQEIDDVDEDLQEDNQEDTENVDSVDNSENNTSLAFRNSKIYWVITAIIFGCVVAAYLTIKFIKSKKYFRNPKKDINNNSKK